MAVALQENEPFVGGTTWWGPWMKCDDHPIIKVLRKNQNPFYMTSRKVALNAMIS
jgi:hypothetical protein